MGPVNHAATVIVFILAVKGQVLSPSWIGDARGKIDVMGNEHGEFRRQAHDKTLVPRGIIVIGEKLNDSSLLGDHNIALPVFICLVDGSRGREMAFARFRRPVGGGLVARFVLEPVRGGDEQAQDSDADNWADIFLHKGISVG